MENRTIFKTRISAYPILFFLFISLLAAHVGNSTTGNYFDNISWRLFGILVMFFFSFDLFFVWSFELQTTKLMVRYPFRFRTPKIHNTTDIAYVYAACFSGRGAYQYLAIGLKDKEIKYYFALISVKSMKELIAKFTEMGIEANVFEYGLELKEYKQKKKL